jgi:hypothetical protein
MFSRASWAKKSGHRIRSTRITTCLQRYSYLVRTPMRPDCLPIPETENNSIPIDPGPAQFNAFYPQCSGHDFASFPEHLPPEHCG